MQSLRQIDTTRALSEEYNEPVHAILGNGGCVKICDGSGLCSRKLIERILNIAAINGIPIQKEVIFSGGSDIGAFSACGFETLFTGLSIPCISMHSRNEQVSVKDAMAIKKLIIEMLRNEQCRIR